MKRVLITGANGFIGANLVARLAGMGHELCLMVRPGSDLWRLERLKDIRRTEAELSDFASVSTVVEQFQPEWIFHLAAHGGHSWHTDVDSIVSSNVVGTVNLLRACSDTGFEAFVNTGSSSEYGFCDHAPAENEKPEPNSCYAVTKASATMFCRYFAQSKDLHIPTLRLYSVYGPWEHPGRLIPTLIVRGLDKELPPLVNPDIARDYVYIDDVIDAYLAAAERTDMERGAIFNVGTGVQTTVREAVSIAIRLMNISAEPRWGSMPDRTWDSGCWIADVCKIKADLGWSAKTAFEQGFQQALEWLRENRRIRSVYLKISNSQ